MPQSYPSNLPPEIQVDTNLVSQKRAACAISGLAAVAQHAMTEATVPELLVAMLGAGPTTAETIGGSIHSGKLDRKTLYSVADRVLSAGDRALLDEVMRLVDTSERARDQLVHGVWGVDEKFADSIIVLGSDLLWRSSLQFGILNAKGGPELHEAEAVQAAMREGSSIWTVHDLQDARLQGVRSFTGLVAFKKLVEAKSDVERGEHRTTIANLLAQR
jgi:hypothetical protein